MKKKNINISFNTLNHAITRKQCGKLELSKISNSPLLDKGNLTTLTGLASLNWKMRGKTWVQLLRN